MHPFVLAGSVRGAGSSLDVLCRVEDLSAPDARQFSDFYQELSVTVTFSVVFLSFSSLVTVRSFLFPSFCFAGFPSVSATRRRETVLKSLPVAGLSVLAVLCVCFTHSEAVLGGAGDRLRVLLSPRI